MRPLEKSEADRFRWICEEIRRALHIEHWEHRYTCEEQPDKESPSLIACHESLVEGRRIRILVFPPFWTHTGDEQLTTLIHEHIHAVMLPVDQVIHHIIDWSHDAARRWSEKTWRKANEHFVDHMTQVILDLVKNRLE